MERKPASVCCSVGRRFCRRVPISGCFSALLMLMLTLFPLLDPIWGQIWDLFWILFDFHFECYFWSRSGTGYKEIDGPESESKMVSKNEPKMVLKTMETQI